MNQALIVTVAVLAFLTLAFFCLRTHGPGIEAEVAALALLELENAGIDWAEPVAEGRTVIIRGTAPDTNARAAAGRLMASVRGVSNISNELQLPDEVFSPVAEAQAYETRIMVSSGFVRYRGQVPDDASRGTIMAQTRKLFGNRRFEDEMVYAEDAPDNWLEAMTTLQQRFATYTTAEAVLSGNRINVIGEVAPGRDGEAKLLAASLPASFRSQISLSVASSESAETCQQRLDDLMQTRVSFEVASEVISKDSFELLNQLASRIAACGGLRIEVAGHTDSEGLAMKNLELSQRRAEAVAAYLVKQGIDIDQLVPWGYGESRPVEDNGTSAGRAANRRIEFRALD